jgi:hypothetical protein
MGGLPKEVVVLQLKVAAAECTVVLDMVLVPAPAPAPAWLVQTHLVDRQVQEVAAAAGVVEKVEATLDPVVTELVVVPATDLANLILFRITITKT